MSQKHTYSQKDEERFIARFFGDRVGRFLDIGAWDAEEFSNTRRLFERGWGGVLVEPSPVCFRKLMRAYRGVDSVSLVNAGVAEDSAIKPFYATEDALSTFEILHRDIWAQRAGVPFREIYLRTITVPELLSAFPGPYEFLNIDVEGGSWELLRSFPLDDIGTLLVCIEYEDHLNEIEEYCTARGFSRVHWTNENLLMGRA